MSRPARLLHVVATQEWEAGGYHPSSLDDPAVGFVHLCTEDQLGGVIDRWFGGDRSGLSVLEFAADDLGSALRWEPVGELGDFPHLYGPLPLASVLDVRPLA